MRTLPLLFSVYFPEFLKFLTIMEKLKILLLPHVSYIIVIQEHIQGEHKVFP